MSQDDLLSLLNPDIIQDIPKTELKPMPNDILYEISTHLSISELLSFCMINKQFNTFCLKNENLNILRQNIGYKTLACGYNNTVFIKNDKLYGIGSNAHGQIGIGVQSKGYGISLKEMDVPDTPLSVSCGSYHTAVLTTGGLYVCGRNHCGQLTGYERHYLTLTKIETPGKVLSVSCQDDTTYIITTKGLYYTGRLVNNKHEFTRIDIKNPLMVSCSNSHVAVMTAEGVHLIGYHKQDGQYREEFIPIDNVLDVSCGTGYTLILSISGLYGIGNNSYGQLGIGIKSDYESLTLIPIDNVKHMSCQYLTSFILLTDGTVYQCGENKQKLTTSKDYYITLPTKTLLTDVINVVSSHEHTIFLKDGSYHGVGSDYHHQIGKHTSKDRDVLRSNLYQV